MALRPDASPVLVVDDDAAVRGAMLGLLRAAGYAAQGYPSAAAALAGADPLGARCALLDIHLGASDGFALRDSLCALAPRLPVIFVSGDADPALAARARRAGALALLHKPVDPDGLLALLETLP
jgi:FixJ family two-component response regulator